MTIRYRDLRYLWIGVENLAEAREFVTEKFGLQFSEQDDQKVRFRSDERNYALCCTKDLETPIIALSVAERDDLAEVAKSLEKAGYSSKTIPDEEAADRQIKTGIHTEAPNGVRVEIVWRPLTSGWRAYPSIDSGITSLNAIALCSSNISEDEKFWVEGLGLEVSDWIGEAAFLRLDEQHHRIALYPSEENGLLGISFEVEDKNNLMVNWYRLKAMQLSIVAGPGRQAASNSMFVSTRGPGGILYTYTVETEHGTSVLDRDPRQFSDTALSHCAWGSTTMIREFLGRLEP